MARCLEVGRGLRDLALRLRIFCWLVGAVLWVATGQPIRAQTPAAASNGIAIDQFVFRYGREHPALPPLEELGRITVPLTAGAGAFGAAVDPLAASNASVVLGSVAANSRFTAPALRTIAEAVVADFNRRGLYGVWVAFDQLELAGTDLVDRRPTDDRTARMTVWASQIAEVRTLARGSRFPLEAATNHRKHAWIAGRSPLKAPAAAGAPGHLFERDRLESYLRSLSGHPARRVEASIASAGEPGLIVLDYLVTEVRAWQVFSQISNTGTDATGIWRGRLGFQHTQLTNHDDVLNADFLTTPEYSNIAAFVSYRRPLIRPGRLTARVYGSFGDFAADGQAFENLRFVGDNWMAGAELTYRTDLRQVWELALNLGATYSRYSVATNVGPTSITKGESPFLVPFLNVVLTRNTEWWSLVGGLRVDQSVPGIARDDPSTGFTALGRLGATADWTSVRTAVEFRTFVEPWLERFFKTNTLAHEALFKVRARFLPGGGRLVPQEQDLVGGAFSVRGYPESIVSADESLTFTAEYAYHVPWAWRPGEPGTVFGRPFAWRPAQPQRRPDWDLVLRTFLDYGQRWVQKDPEGVSTRGGIPLAERNLTLVGTGVGVEVAVKQNVSIRCDVGLALTDLKTSEVTWAKAGDVRAHVVANFFW